MHVALVTRLFPPEQAGETETVVLAQARELVARGHRVDVVCGTAVPLPRGGAEVLHDLIEGVRVHRVPRDAVERAEDRLAGGLEVRPRVRDLVLELAAGAELVHLHHWAGLDGSLVRALARRAPVVVTLHDAFALGPDGPRVPGLLERRLGAFTAELAAARALVAPSRAQAARFEELVGPDRIQVVPHGLCGSPRRLVPAPRPTHSAPLVVAHFGNLSADDGTLDLVRTLSLLPRERVELRLAGELGDPELERAVEGHRRANLIHAVPADAESLRAFLAGSHLAAFPARREPGYGLQVDQALALGLPAWVADRGAPVERLMAWGRPGRVLPAADPLAWAEALRSVLAAPHTLLEQRARVPEALPTAADAVRVLEGLYEAALAEGPAPGPGAREEPPLERGVA